MHNVIFLHLQFSLLVFESICDGALYQRPSEIGINNINLSSFLWIFRPLIHLYTC